MSLPVSLAGAGGSGERQAVARALIDFDRDWNQALDTDAVRFQELFAQQGQFTPVWRLAMPPPFSPAPTSISTWRRGSRSANDSTLRPSSA